MFFPTNDDEPDYEDDDDKNLEASLMSKEELVKEFRNSIKTLETMQNANIFNVTTLASYDQATKKAVINEEALDKISVYELYNQLENIDDAIYLAGLVAFNIMESKSNENMKKETTINKDNFEKFLDILHKKNNSQDGPEV